MNGGCGYADPVTDLRFTVGSYSNTGLSENPNLIFLRNGSISDPTSFDDYIVFARFSGPSLDAGFNPNQFGLRVLYRWPCPDQWSLDVSDQSELGS